MDLAPDYSIPQRCFPVVAGDRLKGDFAIPVIDPSTEEQVSEVVEADAAVVDLAVKTARQTFQSGAWSRASVEKRAAVLNQIADKLEAHADELAWLECRNIGSPLTQCRSRHVTRAILNFRFFAEYISQSGGDSFTQQPNILTVVTREPVGVAALIGPWNAPIALTTMKMASAIAFGNSCVVKPSEYSPLSVGRVVELIEETELPAGVINLVNGRGAVTGAALSSHPDIDVLSFTGGTVAGKIIMQAAGANLVPVTLELGGKSANIIFDDADFDRALDGAVLSIFANNGQQCLAGSRILLQEGIAERFFEEFAARARALKIGDPLAPDTEVGPLANKQHFDRVLSYADTAREEGAKILAGGRKAEGFERGYYFEPTVVVASSNKMKVCQEEIFGPFATLETFRTEEEAFAIANDTNFGLNAYVWTQSVERTLAAHRQLQAGVVNVNSPIVRELRAPFGGFKDSGVGREGGKACEDFYTEQKTTTFSTSDNPLHRMGIGAAE